MSDAAHLNRTPALLACLWILISATPGMPQQVAGANFAKLRQTSAYKQAVIAGAYKTGAWLVDECDNARATLDERLSVVAAPVVVNDREQPQSGSWIEHVAVEGCAKSRRFNVLVSVRQPGAIAIIPMLPGTSHADPVLQKDGAAFAFAAARVDPKGCKPIYLVDTDYLGPLPDKPLVAGKPGWSERWTVAQCDKHTVVDMRFIPDVKGTTIVARRVPLP